jgi:hypothetical protein
MTDRFERVTLVVDCILKLIEVLSCERLHWVFAHTLIAQDNAIRLLGLRKIHLILFCARDNFRRGICCKATTN